MIQCHFSVFLKVSGGLNSRRGFFWVFLFLLVSALAAAAVPCPFCGRENSESALYCTKCLRAIRWTAKPQPGRFSTAVAREGVDAFIRGPNDGHPGQMPWDNAGGDRIGPVGSYYSETGLRYLVRFDVPGAFAQAGVSMKGFEPEEVLLVLRLAPRPEARDDLPIVVFPLTVPFGEGVGIWEKHDRLDGGCNWYRAGRFLPWKMAGGDYDPTFRAEATFPASGGSEIEIDVTGIFQERFSRFQETGIWDDPGLIIMRDPSKASRALYRMIYSFQAAPSRKFRKSDPIVLSPELIIR